MRRFQFHQTPMVQTQARRRVDTISNNRHSLGILALTMREVTRQAPLNRLDILREDQAVPALRRVVRIRPSSHSSLRQQHFILLAPLLLVLYPYLLRPTTLH